MEQRVQEIKLKLEGLKVPDSGVDPLYNMTRELPKVIDKILEFVKSLYGSNPYFEHNASISLVPELKRLKSRLKEIEPVASLNRVYHYNKTVEYTITDLLSIPALHAVDRMLVNE